MGSRSFLNIKKRPVYAPSYQKRIRPVAPQLILWYFVFFQAKRRTDLCLDKDNARRYNKNGANCVESLKKRRPAMKKNSRIKSAKGLSARKVPPGEQKKRLILMLKEIFRGYYLILLVGALCILLLIMIMLLA
jgi:hypothetical protein